MKTTTIKMSSAGSAKIPFSVTTARKGSLAEIRIIGEIGWQASSDEFRREVDALLADGIQDVHLYINTPGGSCVDASEIVNILQKFTGTVTGEGGALVASAGTYIAQFCQTFEMPENGLFMIHKPKGWTGGTAADIEAYLKMMRDTEKAFYEVYKSKAKDPADFDKKWNAGDYWMTAREAMEAGFITSVTKKVTLDCTSADMIATSGYPDASTLLKDFQDNTNKKNDQMIAIAALLGLAAGADNSQVMAAIKELQTKAARADDLEREITAIRDNQITDIVDGAVASRRITADRREHFMALGKSSGIDMLRTTLDAMTPDGKPTDFINPVSPGSAGKKWEDMTASEREQLRETNRAAYDKLVGETYA